jgi:proteasome assembly chaperone (PAC2) family protein
MWEKIVETGVRPKLRDPVLLVALSTSNPQYRAMYSHARELANFMLKKMAFERFATLYASALPPAVVISEGASARLVSANFHHLSTGRDIVLLAGDTSPVDEQYEFCDSVLRFAKELGITELVSVGTRWTEAAGPPNVTPKVLGFATEKRGVEELEGYGVTIVKDEPAPFFASMVVAMAEAKGIRGFKLSVDHGEPVPHPKSVIELLRVLSKMIGIGFDPADLEANAREMESSQQADPAIDLPPRARSGVYG